MLSTPFRRVPLESSFKILLCIAEYRASYPLCLAEIISKPEVTSLDTFILVSPLFWTEEELVLLITRHE
jgi:hypothetical protein